MMRPPKKIDKILFFKVGALGDVVMTTPLVRAIRKRFPKAKIDYMVGSYASVVLKNNPNIDSIIEFDQDIIFKKKIFKLLNLAKKIRKNRYDICFIMDKAWQYSLLSRFFGCFTVGFDRRGEGFATNHKVLYDNTRHEVDFYLSLGKVFGIKAGDRRYDVFLEKKDLTYARNLFRRYKLGKKVIGVIPGGAINPAVGHDLIRRWNPDNFIKLITILKKRYKIILLGGKSDKAFNETILNKVGKTDVYNLTADKIHQSTALMRLCTYVICNDSGPMHFAAASGTKVISLFGPSSPKRKAPLSKGSVSIWKDQDIYEPDYELYGRPPKNMDFMERIEVKDILKALGWKK